jgi:hypothetical protein
VHVPAPEEIMNPTRTVAVVALAVLCSGCVVRTRGVVVAEPVVVAPAPPVVAVAPPPPVVFEPQPVVVAPAQVVITPPVLTAPPAIVLVPGTQVYTVPSASFNVFVYGGRYYSYHHGSWFVAQRHGTPWTAVAVDTVPVAVRSVPAKHWKTPPGHEKKLERAEREGRCPPGLAKKGEC